MADRNYFINGITELLILSILNQKDSYVYEIKKTIENSSDNLLTISQNTIYAATYKLLNEKKISEYSKLVGRRRVRIYYHLEDSGKETLAEIEKNFTQTINGVHAILNNLQTDSKEEGYSNE